MRFAAVAAGVCLALAPCAQTSAEPPLNSLLASVRTAGGAPYARHLRAVVSQTVDGERRDYELQLDGARSFVRHCDGIACRGLYFDGKENFETNLNDTAVPAAPESLFGVSLQAALLEAFADPDFPAQGGQVTLETPVDRAGTAYARVRVKVPLGSTIDVLIDPKTHLVAGLEDATHRVSFVYPEQPNVSPALPSDIVFAGSEGRTQHFTGWALVAEPLKAPAGVVPVFSGAASVLKMLPGRHGGLPVVACTIAGRTVPALLDTGNSSLAMSLELAEQLGIEPSGGAFSIRGVGQYVTGVAEGPAFTLGSVRFPAAKFALLHDVHRYGYELVLGADLFAHANVTIDYGKGEVRIAPAGGEPATRNSAVLSFENFVPVTGVRLGMTNALLALDTGDESTINLGDDFYAKNPGIFTPSGNTSVAGIGGTSTEVFGTIPSVRLAGFDVARQRIGATKGLSPTADGHLGSGFLSHFVATFDYADARLDLAPRSDDPAVSSVPSSSQ